MKKMGIKKTWGNIIMLFVIGMVIGIVIGLRQPMPAKSPDSNQNVTTALKALDGQEAQTIVSNVVDAVKTDTSATQSGLKDSDTNTTASVLTCDGSEPTCEVPVN